MLSPISNPSRFASRDSGIFETKVMSSISRLTTFKTPPCFIPSHLRCGIHPVGRLDFDSRGAILLTNNGDLTLRLTHPKYSHTKTYLVWVSGQPNQSKLDHWRRGILFDDKMTK